MEMAIVQHLQNAIDVVAIVFVHFFFLKLVIKSLSAGWLYTDPSRKYIHSEPPQNNVINFKLEKLHKMYDSAENRCVFFVLLFQSTRYWKS